MLLLCQSKEIKHLSIYSQYLERKTSESKPEMTVPLIVSKNSPWVISKYDLVNKLRNPHFITFSFYNAFYIDASAIFLPVKPERSLNRLSFMGLYVTRDSWEFLINVVISYLTKEDIS